MKDLAQLVLQRMDSSHQDQTSAYGTVEGSDRRTLTMSDSEALEITVTVGSSGVGDARSPVWSRVCDDDFGWSEQLDAMSAPGIDACSEVDAVLKHTRAQHLVIGHCPNKAGRNIRSKCKGKLILADTFMSRGYNQMLPEPDRYWEERLRALRFSPGKKTAELVNVKEVSLLGEKTF